MNAEQLLQHFERISEAPDAIKRLRRFILDLAVRGKLVEQGTHRQLRAGGGLYAQLADLQERGLARL